MRLSKYFGTTQREDPHEAEIPSHKLMLRAGMIHQAASGVYAYYPLAWRSLRKIEQIIREEMDAEGGQELRLSVLQPIELWDRSGRNELYGPDLFRLADRRDRPMAVAPTHEELLTMMVKASARSYRDLPLILYQIHTKFRDELRPRAGLIRVREFDMKDAYSFDVDEDALDASYQAMVRAYKKIYERCGLNVIMVDADSGAIGGKESNEFILLSASGEDTIILCESCGYAANAEKAVFAKPPGADEDPMPLEEVHTPGQKTIEGVSRFLGVEESQTLKAVFYVADGEFVFVVIRGDLEVNEIKLQRALDASDVRLATPREVADAGIVAGSASPVGLAGVRVAADDSVKMGANFVVGANRDDYHYLNANVPRDFEPEIVQDIALAEDGHPCQRCEGSVVTRRGIEVGHVFKLGTRYSVDLDAQVQLADGSSRHILMGCYGIGLGRLLAAAIEQHHDDKGMTLPRAVAPYDVILTTLNPAVAEVSEMAERLYERTAGRRPGDALRRQGGVRGREAQRRRPAGDAGPRPRKPARAAQRHRRGQGQALRRRAQRAPGARRPGDAGAARRVMRPMPKSPPARL